MTTEGSCGTASVTDASYRSRRFIERRFDLKQLNNFNDN